MVFLCGFFPLISNFFIQGTNGFSSLNFLIANSNPLNRGFMQRSIWIVLLPLFVVLLIAVSWVSSCDSADIGNSVRSNFGSALNSVYKRSSTKIRKRRQQTSLGSFWKRPVKELDDAAVKVQKVLYIELEETLQIVQWWLRRFSSWD